jgi:hypothetical protein
VDTSPDYDRLDHRNPGRLTELFVFIATSKGKEGIVVGNFDGEITPYLGTDHARVNALMPRAREFAEHRPDVTVRLVRFERREDICEL